MAAWRSLLVMLAVWLSLAAAATARRLAIEYDAMPVRRPSRHDLVEYVEEPVYGYPRIQDVSDSDIVSYRPQVGRPTQFYRYDRIQKPIKRYLGVEIPDEIAQRNAGGGGALIDRLKQQMQNSG